ncbi:zinc-dependent alcohol dehydrogenase family protein [Streptomyces sp. AK02-01A]|uniref:zinc-dependent alcohol dehydrogenase family protein n=1 Tax=Streptomyces sp. AK02-01A TaxID=3028648 RepID=UPI0029A475AF|nr:zinc-dependent alcohol dehydrogenase family protein [Streptomyces sp. AK02-01A]MDX3854337.1 zinc-dependent alcohol dehydrogenase family protein [Streptomyces sp. AK02-01A]
MTNSSTALAVLFHELGGPDVLKVEEIPLGAPGPDEVRVRVDALGLNKADTFFRAGTYFYQPTLPGSRNGYEAAGVVEAIGTDVTGFVLGDPVVSVGNFELSRYGVYGDRVILPATSVIHRPDSVDAVTGAAVFLTYCTAYGALIEIGKVRPGDHVLITGGSSGVGLAAIEVANRIGAIPVVTTRTAVKKERLLDAGAAHVVVTDEEDTVKEVRAFTGGQGAEFIFDAVGGPGLPRLSEALAHAGTVIIYGWLDQRPAHLPVNWPLTVTGYNNFDITGTADGRRRAAHYINTGLASGAFKPVVDRVFDGLEALPDAHRHMDSNTHLGKIVVTVGH